jgi:hypothetical protein
MKRRRDPLYSNPIAQAVVRSQVLQSLKRLKTDSELQAWAGSAVPELVSDACMLLFAVAWAHKTMRLPADSPDARIMRGLASALADLAAHPAQIETHRPAIQSGLAAIERVLPRLEPLALGVGMVECKNRIAGAGIGSNDIHQLLGAHP